MYTMFFYISFVVMVVTGTKVVDAWVGSYHCSERNVTPINLNSLYTLWSLFGRYCIILSSTHRVAAYLRNNKELS
jgi:hypothetical protein